MKGATVVTFTPAAEHDERARAANDAYYEAYQAIQDDARDAGLPIDGSSPLSRMFRAGHHLVDLWQRRAQRLTRQLQAALASDALSDDQRAAIVKTITGSTRRDANILNAGERDYLDDLRALDDRDRVAVRQIIRSLRQKGGSQ